MFLSRWDKFLLKEEQYGYVRGILNMRLKIFVAIIGIMISGCAARGKNDITTSVQWNALQESYLREELEEFQNRVQSLTESTADKIRAENSDREVRKNAILWKIRAAKIVRDTVSHPNASTALIETWVCYLRMLSYLKEGDGAGLFKEHQALAIDTVQSALDAIEKIAAIYIKTGEMDATRTKLVEYSRKHPIAGVFEERETAPRSLDQTLWSGLTGIVTIPLLPFTTPGKIRKGTRGITGVAERWGDIVEDLPRETRWQAELLLADIHEVNAVRSFLDTADKLSQTAAQVVAIAEDVNKNIELKTAQAVAPVTVNIKYVVDHIAWRIAQLAVLVFVLAALLILLTKLRLRKQPGENQK
jgi:hypothetical protein